MTDSILLIDDLDIPVARIMRLEYAIEFFRDSLNCLCRPSGWRDRFENQLLKAKYVRTRWVKSTPAIRETISFAQVQEDWFGQCWSLNLESDALWQIYSPDCRCVVPPRSIMDIAVQIHSTPRALIADLLAVAASRTGSEAFIGTVQYATQREIQELLTAIGPALLEKRATKKELASTLLLKRGSFDHEKEIRLLWHVQGVAGRIVKYNIDPFKTVSKIVLDPTVDSKLEDEIRSMLALHVNGIPIEKSNLLDFGGFELPLPDV